jgi:heat-inducible transcriptional repressor
VDTVDLGERKKKILQAIIEDFIITADPVGSRTIAKKHDLGLSSATIRNEMADLEELGYLEQPHTSSGRVPSDKGYRLYVDQLMNRYNLTVQETKLMQQAMNFKIQELERIIQHYSAIISKLMQYTTVVITPQMKKSTIKYLQLVPVDSSNILLVIVTSAGIAKNYNIRTIKPLDHEFLVRFSNILNRNLSGLSLEEINLSKIVKIKDEIYGNDEILMSISEIEKENIFLGGTTNIFNFPEYNDIERAKEFLNFLEQKKDLSILLAKGNSNEDNKKINILIGQENECAEMRECSLIISHYSMGGKIVGTIGIIGPTRMQYSKVVSSLEFLTGSLNKVLQELFFEDKTDV